MSYKKLVGYLMPFRSIRGLFWLFHPKKALYLFLLNNPNRIFSCQIYSQASKIEFSYCNNFLIRSEAFNKEASFFVRNKHRLIKDRKMNSLSLIFRGHPNSCGVRTKVSKALSPKKVTKGLDLST